MRGVKGRDCQLRERNVNEGGMVIKISCVLVNTFILVITLYILEDEGHEEQCMSV